jgi:hypothetical protein
VLYVAPNHRRERLACERHATEFCEQHIRRPQRRLPKVSV